MSVTLSARAAEHIKGILEKSPEAIGLRVGVKPSGCAEFSYVIDLAKSINADDREIESQGVKLIVDQNSLEKIDGTEIDYEQQGLNSTIVFHNPHAVNACGCGESFSTKS